MTESIRTYQKLLCEYVDAQAVRDREIKRLRGALEKIEGGHVGGDIPDEDWHGLAAALQEIARVALTSGR